MTTGETDDKRAYVACDTCPAASTPITTSNRMKAQRVAVNFFGWRVYQDAGLWKHACPACVAAWKDNLHGPR